MATAIGHGTTECTIDLHQPHLNIGGTITTQFYNATNPNEPVGVVHEGQDLVVKVTVVLTGKFLHYLCDTQLCVCLAYESCGSGPEGECCKTITLKGDHDPCKTNIFCFEFHLPKGTLIAGECGKQYDICITVSSKDCCGNVGFIFGTCKDFHITVLPALIPYN